MVSYGQHCKSAYSAAVVVFVLMLRVAAISIVSGRVNDVVRRYLPVVALMTAARCRRHWQCGGRRGLRRK